MSEVYRTFRQERRDFHPFAVSIADVRRALESFGARTRAIRVDSREVSALSTPCILYFRPGRWPRSQSKQIGHFVTLVSVGDDDAVLLDWTGMSVDSAVRSPLNQLERVWDGEAIVPVRPFWSLWQTWVGIATALCGVAVWARTWSKSREPAKRTEASQESTGGATLALAVFSMLGLVGCGKSDVSSPKDLTPTLVFEKPLVRAGQIPSGRMFEQSFPFRVWEREPVKIVGFEASCGCTTANKELVGKELVPGSKHVLRVRVRPQNEGTTVTRLVRIHTTPATGAPVVIGVQYRQQDPPRISVHKIIATTSPEALATAELLITYRRPPNDPPVLIDPARCSGTHFTIDSVSHKKEVATINATTKVHIAIDSTVVKMRGLKRLPYGEHTGFMQIAFDDNSEQLLDTMIRIPHPLRPQLSRVFCGILSPAEEWFRSIVCERSAKVPCDVVSVKANGEGLRARLVSGDRLELTGRAPQTLGRFEHEVVISFSPDTIPPLRIPVSGVVRNDLRRK